MGSLSPWLRFRIRVRGLWVALWCSGLKREYDAVSNLYWAWQIEKNGEPVTAAEIVGSGQIYAPYVALTLSVAAPSGIFATRRRIRTEIAVMMEEMADG